MTGGLTGPAGAPGTQSPSRWALGLFAAGDFGFNLYWQSVMLYLLFYYTEALHLPIGTAAACYLVASIWDGVASLAVGVLVDRFVPPRHYRRVLIGGAAPLAGAFVLAYWPSPIPGAFAIGWILAGQLLFRTLYAVVNVPYLAMSARISADSGDRALVAGLRMLAGSAAAVVVAFATVPLGRWLGGDVASSFGRAALLFALAASATLIALGLTYRDGELPPAPARGSLRAGLVLAWRNRAFLTLCAAMMAMIVAVTILNKSVLYYFKYNLADQAAGQLTLAWMMAVSGAAVPLWVALTRAVGVRAVWFLAIILAATGLLAFVVLDPRSAGAVRAFLIGMQVATVGLNFALWAMLPDTIEFGQRTTGVRLEAVLYGYVALLQRIAIGAGTALLGFSLGRAGLSPTPTQAPATLEAFRLTLALAPLGFFALSGVLMLFNPLRRETHAAILRELADAR